MFPPNDKKVIWETGPIRIGGDEIELGTPRYKWFIHYTRVTPELARIQTYTKLWVESDFDI